MPTWDASSLVAEERATATWAAALLHALARDEAAGRRPERLTEPSLATWRRFRGRLTSADLVALVFEDAAVNHAVPFDAALLGEPIDIGRLSEAVAERWVAAVRSSDLQAPGASYIGEQARLLGFPTHAEWPALHNVKPHHCVLELPGTGGQFAHHLCSAQQDLTLKDNFAIACGSWQELTLAGVIGLDLGSANTDFAYPAKADDLRAAGHPLRRRKFEFVVGLHPAKGGLFRIEDQLAIWFPNAEVLLV